MPKNSLHLFHSTVFFKHLAIGVLIPTLIIWQSQNGLRYGEIAWIQSIGYMVLLIAELPSSFLADHYSLRKTVILGVAFLLACLLLLTQANTFGGFLSAQVALSIGLAMVSGTYEAWLHSLSQKHKKNFTGQLSIMQITDEVGTMVGMALSSLCIWYGSLPLSYAAGAVALVFAMGGVFILPEDNSHSPTESESWKESLSILKNRIASSQIIMSIILLIIFLAVVSYRGEIVFQAFFETFGVDLKYLGGIYIFAKVGAILGSAMTPFLKRVIKSFPLFVGFFIIQSLVFLLLQSSTLAIGILALFLYFMTENILRNLQKTAILDWAPGSLRASLLSLTSLTSALFLIPLSPAVGYGIEYSLQSTALGITTLKTLSLVFLFLAARIFQKTDSMT